MDVVRKIVTWWRQPITRKDRWFAALVGAMGGVWIGLLICMVLAAGPMSLVVWGVWALSGAITCALLGALFPRVVSVLIFPLTLLGIG
ncbi:hypothetical protein K5Q02_04760 [Pseudomonas sp. MM211]|uniref:hypothetical protein n=1 Tax=Pseudomonas sp. MM211 TaxID=2866808 RepID=UPI001CECB2DB|nr:hypothetical protein [Pseudomonas sp. MM211]UCJ17694.1 hypothetical protein K5Q02_04760 [Pseudomonas sp. MM211]